MCRSRLLSIIIKGETNLTSPYYILFSFRIRSKLTLLLCEELHLTRSEVNYSLLGSRETCAQWKASINQSEMSANIIWLLQRHLIHIHKTFGGGKILANFQKSIICTLQIYRDWRFLAGSKNTIYNIRYCLLSSQK